MENITEYDEAVKNLRTVRENECLVIDGATITTLLGLRSYNYYLNHRLVSTFPEQLQPLKKNQSGWKKFKQWISVYLTGHTQKSLGENDPRNEFA